MIYYSHRTRQALAHNLEYLPLGYAHYSYGSVCKKFIPLLSAQERETQEILMPEIYAHQSHIFRANGSIRPVHIAFKPFDEIRLLRGATNVAHVAWEFDKLPQITGLPQGHPRSFNMMNDYVHTLSLLSEIWVGCTYTKKIFERHGLGNVQVVPAPITGGGVKKDRLRSLATSLRRIGSFELTRRQITSITEGTPPRLAEGTLFRADDCTAAGGRVFLSVLNPGDPRKNVAALLFGFQDFLLRTKRNDMLIVKLVVDGQPSSLAKVLSETLPTHFDNHGLSFPLMDCARILVVPSRLSEQDMASLYDAAHFYVCTSGAEGQGLPVQEAMAVGMVPISSRETAMADYVTEENGVVMQTEEAPLPMQISLAYGLSGISWRTVTAREVSRALESASAMAHSAYEKRAAAAAATIERQYSPARVGALFDERIDYLTAVRQ